MDRQMILGRLASMMEPLERAAFCMGIIGACTIAGDLKKLRDVVSKCANKDNEDHRKRLEGLNRIIETCEKIDFQKMARNPMAIQVDEDGTNPKEVNPENRKNQIDNSQFGMAF